MSYERDLLNTYRDLHSTTRGMADAAKSSDWVRFSEMEKESVRLLNQIADAFKLELLSVTTKAAITIEVQAILGLQNHIHQYADAWRRTQTQQKQSDTMRAKLNNAYS